MVVIVDPHQKRTQTYPVYKEASELQILVKPSSGEGEYEGWCWSGSSSWVDFFNPKSWDWWKGAFKTTPSDKFTWVDSTENVGVWNDMNEVCDFSWPVSGFVLMPYLALSIQRTGNYDAKGQRALWRLGTS